jgi:membrane protein YdbS with pleckstrin-like domain
MTWFEPEDVPWTFASRRLIAARAISLAFFILFPMAGAIFLGVAMGGWFWAVAAGMGLIAAWAAWLMVRQVTAHAWAERADDLIVKRGRVFRSVTVVPYGRMQYVEVSAGPIARAFGIARVQLHTASPGTDAHLAGVPAEEAARLRDRLTARGEARLAGL